MIIMMVIIIIFMPVVIFMVIALTLLLLMPAASCICCIMHFACLSCRELPVKPAGCNSAGAASSSSSWSVVNKHAGVLNIISIRKAVFAVPVNTSTVAETGEQSTRGETAQPANSCCWQMTPAHHPFI
jgi:hypothetical protein